MRLKKICYVSSCGGHLTEILNYSYQLDKYECFYVINQKKDISYLNKNVYFVDHSTLDIKFFKVLYQALIILLKEKPELIISTGASLAVQFFIIAKLLGIKTIFIESLTRINTLSKTGKIIRFLTPNFLVQTKTLSKKYTLNYLDPGI